MVEFALMYAQSLGWFVFPCYPMRSGVCGCGRPQCVSPGKHPVWIEGLIENGLRDATTDEATIRAWWAAVPDANIGVVMEPSGLCGLDLDDYKTTTAFQSAKEESDLVKLAVLEQTLGDLPSTVTQRSGSGEGYHAIFKTPGFPVKGIIGGIVVRAKAYIIVAPSNHASGGKYEWQQGLGPGEIAVAEFPDTWKAALEKKATVGSGGVPDDEPEWLQTIPAYQRLADARAHIAREKGEIKGQSKPGTTFDVIRSVIRRYAIRDQEVALELAQEYDTKCIPPWGPRIARHVWSAYNRANEPSWGFAYRGVAERLSMPAVPDIAIMSTLEGIRAKRTTEPARIQDKSIVKAVLEKKYLGDNDVIACETLIRLCPAGTSDAQIMGLLVNCGMPDQRAEELVTNYRLAHAAKMPSIAEAMPEVMIAGVPLGPSLFIPDGVEVDESEPPPDSPDRQLLGRLRMDEEENSVKDTPHNLSLILKEDSLLKGKIRFNELTKEIHIDVPPFNNKNPNTVATHVMNYLDTKWHLSTSQTKVEAQILAVARENSYNPIAEYLNSLVWDGVPRIDTWLIDYMHAEDTVFNRRVGSMWLIAACARGIKPGSKVDTVLVLEGPQGARKSTAAARLGGTWFSDSPLVIGNKDSQMMASFCWIIELAELASLRASETESQKAFLSQSNDKYRPPYGKAIEAFLRFAVFIGTTNDDEYLPDQTGNRRYWPVRVGENCDTIRLMSDRDQLWAEAVYRYKNSDLNPQFKDEACPGERWWFATKEEEDMARGVVDKRRPENVWATAIHEWVGLQVLRGPGQRLQWTLVDLACEALKMDVEKVPSKQKLITAALKDAGLQQTKGPGGRPMWKAPESLVKIILGERESSKLQPPITN